ncbi:DUF2946 family protein [Roseibium sp.]|uniref:DUF2946 family protein n=1 Tax=Roseibium sp. TaxID=1936156 RepID=UPI00391B9D0A
MGELRQNIRKMNAAVFVLLLPFLLSALLPQGFMPSLQKDKGFTVVLCTPDGMRTITLNADGKELPSGPMGDDEGKASSHCVFSGVGAVVVPVLAPDSALPVFASLAIPFFAESPRTSSLNRSQNGARAPPLGI